MFTEVLPYFRWRKQITHGLCTTAILPGSGSSSKARRISCFKFVATLNTSNNCCLFVTETRFVRRGRTLYWLPLAWPTLVNSYCHFGAANLVTSPGIVDTCTCTDVTFHRLNMTFNVCTYMYIHYIVSILIILHQTDINLTCTYFLFSPCHICQTLKLYY